MIHIYTHIFTHGGCLVNRSEMRLQRAICGKAHVGWIGHSAVLHHPAGILWSILSLFSSRMDGHAEEHGCKLAL